MTLLILFGLVAVAVSFLCSLLEACLLSLPRSYVELMVERGTRAGAILRDMKSNIDRPLAAILTMNTVAHTVGAVGVGAQAAVVFGNRAVGVASAIMTILVLVVSEIIPKTLGAIHAKPLAAPAAMIIRLMILLCLPLIVVLEWVNRVITVQRHEDSLSRAELLATLRLGHPYALSGVHTLLGPTEPSVCRVVVGYSSGICRVHLFGCDVSRCVGSSYIARGGGIPPFTPSRT